MCFCLLRGRTWFSEVSWFLYPALANILCVYVFLGHCLPKEHLSVSVGEIWAGTFLRAGWNFWKWIWKWLSCGVDIFSEYLYVVWVLGFRHVQRSTLEMVYLKSDLFRKVDLQLEVFMGDFPWAMLQATYICAVSLKLMLSLLGNTPVYFSSKRTQKEFFPYQTFPWKPILFVEGRRLLG